MIIAKNLSKQYKKKRAVNDISFVVETSKVTGFLGPNGAGKSTTMRLMLGLDKGSGTTTFDGKKLHEYTTPANVVGILLEAKAFHPTRSARQHLAVLAEMGGIPLSRVDEVLETVGLSEVAKKKPGKFSLGMSQRLGIAAAILGKPKYLMLDEPANGLDPEGIHWLRQFLRDYADQGNAVLVSSHLLSEMSLMADNLVVIGKGRLITTGSVDDFINASSGAGVFVRSPKIATLEKSLSKEYQLTKQGDGLKISGAKCDDIGKLAFELGVPLHELSPVQVTLEDAFLEVTASSQEYSTANKKEQQNG